MEARPPIKIHILHCGTVSVSPSVPEGGLSLGGALGGVCGALLGISMRK